MKKSETLRNKGIIEKIFSSKDTITIYKNPFCIKFLDSNDINGKTLITVPKKKFKKAVDRNLLKRRIKSIFDKYPNHNKNMVIIYNSYEKYEYITMKDALNSIFKKII